MSGLFGADSTRRTILCADRDDGASAWLIPAALSHAEADMAFSTLLDEIPWQQRDIVLFGKRHRQPRLIAWHGDAEARYTYSRQTMEPEAWTPRLEALRQRCSELTNATYNSVLCNLYRDGNDAMGWHADDEPSLGAKPVIASLSLGCERRFDLRHKISGKTYQLWLPSGSLLVMAGRTQQDWKHQLPRSKKVHEPRINLTFRLVSQARSTA